MAIAGLRINSGGPRIKVQLKKKCRLVLEVVEKNGACNTNEFNFDVFGTMEKAVLQDISYIQK